MKRNCFSRKLMAPLRQSSSRSRIRVAPGAIVRTAHRQEDLKIVASVHGCLACMVRRVFSSILPFAEGVRVALADAEARHLTGALRLRVGAVVEALDGQGRSLRCCLSRERADGGIRWFLRRHSGDAAATAEAGLPLSLQNCEAPPLRIVMEVGILKADAMSAVVDACCQLGVHALVPIAADRSVVKIGADADRFVGRWQRIADNTLKQSGRTQRMAVERPQRLAELLHDVPRIFCDETSRASPHIAAVLDGMTADESFASGSVLHVSVGPEGGWSPAERHFAHSHLRTAVSASLGPTILRAETAVLAAAVTCRNAMYRRAWPTDAPSQHSSVSE